MGVYSPVPMLTRRLQRQIEQRVLVPAVHALRREEIEFRGVLYAGLMITESGPKVLEFNARFGDPECQALVRRLKGDLLAILLATAKGELASIEAPDWDPRVCVGVVAAAEGYPSHPRKGDPISGLESAGDVEDAVVFHAGTARQKDGELVTAGGRVLCVTALGSALDEARERAYAAYDRIAFQGKQCRRDIGLRVAARPLPVEHEGDEAGFEAGGGSSGNAPGPARRGGGTVPRPPRHASGLPQRRPAPGSSPP